MIVGLVISGKDIAMDFKAVAARLIQLTTGPSGESYDILGVEMGRKIILEPFSICYNHNSISITILEPGKVFSDLEYDLSENMTAQIYLRHEVSVVCFFYPEKEEDMKIVGWEKIKSRMKEFQRKLYEETMKMPDLRNAQ